MTELKEKTRRVAGSRMLDLFTERSIESVVDPFMGLPTHLNYLKRHGIRVDGGDLLEWFVRAGEGLVVNDFTILREDEVAAIVEGSPGSVYPVDMFRAWDGVFFSHEQCQYLGIWHANIRNLRSDGQTGLAIAGLWHVLCYWLQKAQFPDDMPDIPPSELAWRYIRETERLVCGNNARNTVRQADFATTLQHSSAQCVYVAPPGRNSASDVDARVWMWEAWWQGDPYLSVERYFRDTVFGRRQADRATYDDAIGAVLTAAESFPFVVLQTRPRDTGRFERIVKQFRKQIEIVAPGPEETYIIARK
ncbi:MAG: hypothetical protein ABSB70_10035 [Candidatus Velthaea sp.]